VVKLSKIFFYLGATLVALTILFVSILRSASVKYSFSQPPGISVISYENTIDIDYELASPGNVLPGNPLWSLKVARDMVWLAISTSPSRKAELSLLFADKRLSSAKILFERKEYESGYMTLIKGEGYLEAAFYQAQRGEEKGEDMSAGLTRIAVSALKHRQVIDDILQIAPEDAKPEIIKTQDISKKVYKLSRDELNEIGKPLPKSPFEGD
jgi:hypothetical protein